MVEIAIVAAGVVAVVVLAQRTVDGSLRLADHLHLTGTFVGLTILSVGTSLPEIAAHVAGSLRIVAEPDRLEDVSGLVVGGNIGSDIFQQNVALPLVALTVGVVVARRDATAEIGALVSASVIVLLVGLGGTITRLEGAGLVALYAIYLWLLANRQVDTGDTDPNRLPPRALPRIVLSLGVGLGALAVVSALVLASAERLVERSGLDASFMGIITVGVASAMPELTTSLAAARRGEPGAAGGILIGSNVTNPLFAMGVGAVISTYHVPTLVLAFDLPVKIATALLLAAFFRRSRMRRGEAVGLIALYAVYLGVRLAIS